MSGVLPNGTSEQRVADSQSTSSIWNCFGLCRRGKTEAGKMPHGQSVSAIVTPEVAAAAEKSKRVLSAAAALKEDNLRPSIVTYNTLIDGYSKAGKFDEAKALLLEMEKDNLRPSVVTYNTLIDGYSKAGKFDEAKALLRKMKEDNLPPNVVTYNMLIEGYLKAGKFDEVKALLRKMEKDNLRPNVVTYNMLIGGYSKAGKLDEAEEELSASEMASKLLHDMLKNEKVNLAAEEKLAASGMTSKLLNAMANVIVKNKKVEELVALKATVRNPPAPPTVPEQATPVVTVKPEDQKDQSVVKKKPKFPRGSRELRALGIDPNKVMGLKN